MSLAQSAHVFRLTIVVHPGHTDRGIGRALMNDLLSWATQSPRVEKLSCLFAQQIRERFTFTARSVLLQKVACLAS
jgi:L-phenylalanine/L-methionine N-acetyltransferase